MMGSANPNVNRFFRTLNSLPLAGLAALVILAAHHSETRAMAAHHHEGDAQHVAEGTHHLTAQHLSWGHLAPAVAAAHLRHAAHDAVASAQPAESAEAGHRPWAHRADINRAGQDHAAGGRLVAAGAWRVATPAAARGHDTSYVRYATGINIYGSPKDWHALAPRYGYYVSRVPVPGGAVCFEQGAYGADDTYGLVAVVVYYRDEGGYWHIVTRYAHQGAGQYEHSPVEERVFRVRKNDPAVHYIYRGGAGAGGYYYRPEYAHGKVEGRRYPLTGGTGAATVYAEGGHTSASAVAGQPVRVLAQAAAGETLWVFVETPYRAGETYAVTHDGGRERFRKFDARASESARMYYVKGYGDAVLDLGYVDYSALAGAGGKLTITIKKGEDPSRLVPVQTVTLRLARK